MAMGKTQKTEILIETHEVIVIRFRERYQTVVCEICSKEVHPFTAEQAARIRNLPSSVLRRRKGDEAVHPVAERTPQLFCGASLGADSSSIENDDFQEEIKK